MNDVRFRVLLVEDDRHDARVIETILASSRESRFEVEWVARLSVALTHLLESSYDLVLADLSLPDSQGMETFDALRRGSPDVPIVVLSGLDDERIASRAVQAGAQDYLVKSRDNDETMVRAIHYAIRRFRAGLQQRQRSEHLRLLTQQLPCVFWTTDTHLNFTSLSGADQADWAEQPVALGQQNLVNYFQSQGVDPAVIEAHRSAARGEPSTFDLHWNDRIYHLHVEPFRRRDGRVIGTIGLALDVTDQKHADLERRVTRRVHAGLLPEAAPCLPGYDIAGNSLAAADAGGDYFDFFPLTDGTTAIVVCDVAGHGLGPAMMMCQTRAYIRALALAHTDPGKMLSLVNEFLCRETKDERLVALLLAKLDAERSTLTFANAGHRGFVIDPAGEALALPPTAIPLNVLGDTVIETAPPRRLAAGEIVLLYTDGVIEALSAAREPFGIHGMLDCVRDQRQRPAREIVDALFAAVQAFARDGLREDDMTAVIIKKEA